MLTLSAPALALNDYIVSMTPNFTVINNSMSVNQLFNFTINNSNTSGVNITQVNITWPSGVTYVQGSDGSTVPQGFYAPSQVDIQTNTIRWANNTPFTLVNTSNNESFWFNVSAINVGGIYNFTLRLKDTNNVVNVTNISFNVGGIVPANLPSSLEFGSETVTIGCSARTNSSLNNLANMTIRISNFSIFNPSTQQWSPTSWAINNITSVSGVASQVLNTTTLWGNYSDLYKYVFRCEVNETSNLRYMSPSVSFIVSMRNFTGYLKNSSGSNLGLANVSIYRFIEGVNGPPTESYITSVLTGSDGNFSFSNINTTRLCTSPDGYSVSQPMSCEPMFRLKMIYPNPATGPATQVGPQLPAFPRTMLFGPDQTYTCPPGAPAGMRCGPPSINGTTIYTQSAATINLTAINYTNTFVNFGYEIIDQTLGYPVESNVRTSVSNVLAVVPTGRSYTVMFVRDPASFSSGAVCQSGPAIMTPTLCPAPPLSNASLGTLTAGSVVNVTMNFSFGMYNLTGCINIAAGHNNSAINITKVVPKLVPWAGFIPPMKAEMGNGFDITDTGDLNYSDPRCPGKLAYYRLDVMGSTSGMNYFVEFFGKNASSDAGNPLNAVSVAAFQNVTVYTANANQNITLRALAGSYATGGDANTSKVTVNLFKNTNNKTSCNAADNTYCFALSTPHVEVTIKDSNIYNGLEVKYIIESLSSGSFSMPLLNTSTAKVSIFEQSTSPTKKTLNLSQTTSNITIYPFMPQKVLPNGTMVEYNKTDEGAQQNITFYRSGNSSGVNCDVYNPPASCALEGGTFSGAEFDPMKAMMAGKVNMRLTTPNITLYFINVDLLASGPPEPDRSEQALSGGTSTSSSLQAAWKFGSVAPNIYDSVLIGVNQTGFNSSWGYNISIPALYGEDMSAAPAWNRSAGDTASNVPDDYTDYNATGSAYAAFLTSSGMPCSFSNSSSTCYIDSANSKMWLKIPHFSGIQPTITGAAPAGAAAAPAAAATGGGGGGGGGISNIRVFQAKGNANVSIQSVTAGGSANVTITKYEDMALRQINISVANAVNKVNIVINKLAGLPAAVTHEISGNVYHYIEVTKENITDADVNKVRIKFAVNKSWLTANNIATSEVILYRWADGKWNALPTTFVGGDTAEAFYTAESPGLSYFAIGTVEAGAPPAACEENWQCTEWSACANGEQTRTCTDQNACGTTVNRPAETQACGIGKITPENYLSIAVILVIIILVLAIFYTKGKKKW